MKVLVTILLFVGIELSANSIGSLLFYGNCATCHDKTKNISAPSISSVRASYKNAFPKREDFVKQMSTWVQHPKEESSIMLPAVKKYKLMPELVFDIDTLKDIAGFIYETDFKE